MHLIEVSQAIRLQHVHKILQRRERKKNEDEEEREKKKPQNS